MVPRMQTKWDDGQQIRAGMLSDIFHIFCSEFQNKVGGLAERRSDGWRGESFGGVELDFSMDCNSFREEGKLDDRSFRGIVLHQKYKRYSKQS